ncbi:hypothetical protein BGX23_003450 [Mortierella sp. AD031]|nr:hypothetical protein BGX23_003450 [Mortierella sp. AD031]
MLGPTSSAGSSPTADGTSPSQTTTSQAQTADSPQPDAAGGSPFQKPIPRAWGAVAQTPEQHLAEYPTAAEAAKKLQDQQGEHHHGNGNAHHAGNTNAGSKPTATITTSGEPMAKTVSALSGGDNWDEADDDEGVDFLNAEAIEFADGSVVVAAAVAQTIETSKDAEAEKPASTSQPAASSQPTTSHQTHTGSQPTTSHQPEERVVDRGDVDFNRSLPNRVPPTSGHSLYQPNQEHGPRYGSHDRNHPSLWQGGPNDRRSSADRTQGYHPSQRRESFGNRDHSGPPRRDSYDRREPPNRSGSYSRDRDMPYRDSDFDANRRPSHDRQMHTSDRFSDRPTRDYQLLPRPKDASTDRPGHYGRPGFSDPQGSHTHGPLDRADPYHRVGPHDVAPTGYRGAGHYQQSARADHTHHEPSPTKDGHDPRLGSYGHLVPQGAVEYDRPAQVTEEQREAMKHAAEEARRRRQEEEAKYEEAKARARARADELAKKAEEAKLAKEKEEQEAKEKEEREAKAKEERAAEEAARVAKAKELTEALKQANVPQTVREFGDPKNRPHMVELTEEGQQDAMAKWQALPGRLAKEDAEKAAIIREKRRLEEEQKQSVSNGEPSSSAALLTPTPATSTSASTVGPWRRGQPLPKAKSEPPTKSDTSGKKEERAKDISKDKSATPSSQAVASNEPRVDQLDKVMHRIEESFQSRGNSVQAMEANMKRPEDHAESTDAGERAGHANKTSASSNNDKGPQKERTRNAKATRAERENGDSSPWRKEDHKIAASKEVPVTSPQAARPISETTKPSTATNGDGRPGRMSRSAATTYYKGNYPAKANGMSGVAKISDITKIHARLSLQSAGDQNLAPAEEFAAEIKPDKTISAKSEPVKSGSLVKRNSLSNSNVATIFPLNVEKAARNRGSMSFMVDSEIDPPPTAEVTPPSDDTTTKGPKESSGQVEEQEWDHSMPSDSQHQPMTPLVSHGSNSDIGVPHSVETSSAGSGLRLDTSIASDSAQHSQPIWGTTSGADSASQGGAHPMMIAASGVTGTGHPSQPYPVMMPPYYPQGYPPQPMFFQRPLPPPMYAFPGGAMAPYGSMPISPVDARGSPELASQALSAVTSGPAELQTDNGNLHVITPSSSILGPHHWLPRFSVAGDAPPQQAIVSAGPFMVPGPTPQQAASMMAAANINRVPQLRPYGHHPQMMQQHPLPPAHTLKHPGRVQSSGPASLETSFQEGSTSNSPASNGGRNQGQMHAGPGPVHSWAPGAARANAMGGPGGNVSVPYANYQPSPQHGHGHGHGHPNSGRGGRGGYGNYHPVREFRPRGGYAAGHLNQPHLQGGVGPQHPSYAYGHHPHHAGQTGNGSMDPTHQHPHHNSHQNSHQQSQHLAGPPPRVSHSAVATPAVNSLQF